MITLSIWIFIPILLLIFVMGVGLGYTGLRRELRRDGYEFEVTYTYPGKSKWKRIEKEGET